jgi:hypothetical protein
MKTAVQYITENLDFENPLNWQTVFKEAQIIEKQNTIDMMVRSMHEEMFCEEWTDEEMKTVRIVLEKFYNETFDNK